MLKDEDMMPFGKHGPKGTDPKPIGEVPASYLLWLLEQDWIHKWPHVKSYIEAKREQLETEADENSKYS